MRTPLGGRVLAAFAAAACLALLIVSARLTPSPLGHATHLQLGMYPCGWVVMFDKPCPTCGMTTSFAHAADMNMVGSLKSQPMATLLALLTAAGFWAGAHVAATGSRVGTLVGACLRAKVGWVMLALLIAAWGYKLATWKRSNAPTSFAIPAGEQMSHLHGDDNAPVRLMALEQKL